MRRLLSLAMLAIVSRGVGADTLHVPGDYNSIQEAINVASDGDVVQLATGFFHTSELDLLGKAITLRGMGMPHTVVTPLFGGGIIRIEDGETAATVIEHISFKGGSLWTGGAIRITDGSPTIRDCAFSENFAFEGGALWIGAGSPSVEQCVFSLNGVSEDNADPGYGGAVYIVNASPTLTDCLFEDNQALDGGAGGAIFAKDSTVTLQGCTIRDNHARLHWSGTGGLGGGMAAENAIFHVTDCTVSGNSAAGTGGGAHAVDTSITLVSTDVCSNTPNQIVGPWTDGGGACVSEFCDGDNDGTPDCDDGCPGDPNKTAPGICGCGEPDVDSDEDGVMDCDDGCPSDPYKTEPGFCGCGVADVDSDGDGLLDCEDPCPTWSGECIDDGETLLVAVGESIQDAIDAAPDEGFVQLAPGTHLSHSLNFHGRPVSLLGATDASGNPASTIDGEGGGSVLLCVSGETDWTVIYSVVITGGLADRGGGIYISEGSSPTIENCRFEGNHANLYGGGMYAFNSESFIYGCDFISNSSGLLGGGAQVTSGGGTLFQGCTFDGNTASGGAGMYAYQTTAQMMVCTITSNAATEAGGGLVCDGSDVSVVGSKICSNTPDQVAGDWVDLGSNCVLDICDADGNGVFDCYDPDPACPDPNGDGTVNIDDLLIVLDEFGTCSEACAGDVDGNGSVTIDDVLELISGWGLCE